MEIRALTEEERIYAYTQDMQLQGQTGCIGYLRGDFGSNGDGFYTTWTDNYHWLKSDEFKAELGDVINALRSEEYGLLQNRVAMGRYVAKDTGSAIEGSYCTEYGFRVDTEKRAYLLRCNPIKGDYNFYCYCYESEWLDRHMKKAQQGIRFINSNYDHLFMIPDGGKIVITDSSGKKSERTCRFIDEYHTVIGNNLYHICQFAEVMERNGSTYAPVPAEEKVKEQAEEKGSVQAEDKAQEMEKDKEQAEMDLQLTDPFGNTWQVQVEVDVYLDNKSLCVSLTTMEDGIPEPYGNVTVNLDGTVPNYCAYVDTNNMPDIEAFLVENGIAESTGLLKGSGYCVYPLYLFNPERLRGLCPEGMAAYEAENGIKRTEKKEEKCR